VSDIVVSDESDAKACKLMAVNTFDALHSAIADFSQNIESTIAYKTEKEVQLNDWVHKILTTELRNYRFETWCSYSTNRFSLFGSSQPDLAFSNRTKRNTVAAAILKIPDFEQEENLKQEAVLSTIEFKPRELVLKHQVQFLPT